MSSLTVRRPDFRIDESVPFQWQPRNPSFGLFANAFTFVAIAFERYIVSATRLVADRLADSAVADEAEDFVRQEAQHARAHRAHAKAMIARYPELAQTLAEVQAGYDDLLGRRPVEFHLAYIANLEATFTPLFKMMLDNRHGLFEGGDERVGTLLLWHFVEEIEHRSSALRIYLAATGDPGYRLRQVPATFRHVTGVFNQVLAGFEAHVPLADRHLPTAAVRPTGLLAGALSDRTPWVRQHRPRPSLFTQVPTADLRAMAWRLARSQRPGHDPATEALPTWADRWHQAWDRGDDVSRFATVGL